MAPIHDTDLASERWAKAQWRNFELWEKLEVKIKQRRWIWIIATGVLFLLISSVPVIQDQSIKWQARAALKRLALEINSLKRMAATEHQAYLLRFVNFDTLEFVVERRETCETTQSTFVRNGFLNGDAKTGLTLLTDEKAEKYDLRGLLTEICYDPVLGSNAVKRDPESGVLDDRLFGFAILPTVDLDTQRADRLKILLIKGTTVEAHLD